MIFPKETPELVYSRPGVAEVLYSLMDVHRSWKWSITLEKIYFFNMSKSCIYLTKLLAEVVFFSQYSDQEHVFKSHDFSVCFYLEMQRLSSFFIKAI